MPRNNFNAGVSAYYGHDHNPIISTCEKYKDGSAVILKPINDGNLNDLQLSLNLFYAPINPLRLSAMIAYHYTSLHAYSNISLNNVYAHLSAGYYINNFNFQAVYAFPNKVLSASQYTTFNNYSEYFVSAGWAKGDFSVQVYARCFLRNKWKGKKSTKYMPYYSYTDYNTDFAGHSSIRINLTYTFGYGKKVQRGNEIGAQKGISSGVLH